MARRLTPHRPVPADPVFVDRSGRRRRVVVTLSAVVAAVLLAGTAALAVGIATGHPAAVPGWPSGEKRLDDDSAVIGRRPTPAPAAPPQDSPGWATRSNPAAAPTGAAPSTSRPGRGGGRSNRPTTKPDKSPDKPT